MRFTFCIVLSVSILVSVGEGVHGGVPINDILNYLIEDEVKLGAGIEEIQAQRTETFKAPSESLGLRLIETIDRNTAVTYYFDSGKLVTIQIAKEFLNPQDCREESEKIVSYLEPLTTKETRIATTLNNKMKAEEFPLSCWVSESSPESVEIWHGSSANGLHLILLDSQHSNVGDYINVKFSKESIEESLENMKQRRARARETRAAFSRPDPMDGMSKIDNGSSDTVNQIEFNHPELVEPPLENKPLQDVAESREEAESRKWLFAAGSTGLLIVIGWFIFAFYRFRSKKRTERNT